MEIKNDRIQLGIERKQSFEMVKAAIILFVLMGWTVDNSWAKGSQIAISEKDSRDCFCC